MKTSLTIRFGILAISITLSALLMSCESVLTIQKDPGALPTGDYKLPGTTSYTINGAVSAVPLSGTLTVYSSDSTSLFYLVEKAQGYQRSYQAKQIGETLKLEEIWDNNTYSYVSYLAKQQGSGTLANGRIELDRYVNTTSQNYVSPTGEKSTYTTSIRKHVHIEAHK